MSTYDSQHDPSQDDGLSEMRGETFDSFSRDRRTAAATLDTLDSGERPRYRRRPRLQKRARFDKRSGFEAYDDDYSRYEYEDQEFDSLYRNVDSHQHSNDSKGQHHGNSGADNRASYSLGILSVIMLVSLCAFLFSSSPQAFVVCTGLCSILLIVFNAALENLIQQIAARLHGKTKALASKSSHLFNGVNLAMILMGIVLPSIVITFGATFYASQVWSMFLKHPFEMLIYTALVVGAPAANCFVLASFLYNKADRPRLIALFCGIAAGVSLCTGLLSCLMFREFDALRSLIVGGASAGCFATAVMLYCRLMRRPHIAGDRACKIAAGVSMLLSILTIGAIEAKPAAMRVAETFALATNAESRRGGIAMLNFMGAAPDILEEIKYQDPTNVGSSYFNTGGYGSYPITRYDPVLFKPSLSLAFFKIFDEESQSIYYRMTGHTPEGARGINTSLTPSDQFPWMGGVVDTLELSRSKLTGNINSETLSSYMDWTFELTNSGNNQQEAKMRLGLPKGAVVSRLTAWIGGQPHEAQFSTTSNAEGAYSWVVRGRRDPVLVKQIDKDFVEVDCFPVPAMGTMQVRIGITTPVNPETSRKAKMDLPFIHSSNFNQNSCKTQLNVKADSFAYAETLGSAEHIGSRGGAISCEASLNRTTSLVVSCNAGDAPIIAEDTRSGRKSFTVTRMLPVIRKRPAKVVVVLDGSSTLAPYREEIANGLKALPENEIPTTFVLASDEDSNALSGKTTLSSKVASVPLVGGQLNERFLKAAVTEAGNDGCVLWIHGLQVVTDPEVSISSVDPLTRKKALIYDLQVGPGYNSIANGLTYNGKPAIESIKRSGAIAADLQDFCNRELARTHEFKVVRDHADAVPADAKVIPSGVASTQLATLWAHDEIERLYNQNWSAAEAVGMLYRVVSPTTSAVVLERASDYTQYDMQEPDSKNYSKNAGFADAKQRAELVKTVKANATSQMIAFNSDKNTGSQTQQYNSGQAPQLQGATNGTVGPQGQDATVIYGVNSAGTVRVNNMANIEAVLNIFANALEILGLCWGVPNIILGVMRFGMMRDAAVRIGVGIGSVTFGLATPGIVNWLCSAARDANLFS